MKRIAVFAALIAFSMTGGANMPWNAASFGIAFAENADDRASAPGGEGVHLNVTTWPRRILVSVQAMIAPERLKEHLPIFVYKRSQQGHLCDTRDVFPETPWHVGAVERSGNSVWTGTPCPPVDELRKEKAISCLSHGEYFGSSIPLRGSDVTESLWVAEDEWEAALPPPTMPANAMIMAVAADSGVTTATVDECHRALKEASQNHRDSSPRSVDKVPTGDAPATIHRIWKVLGQQPRTTDTPKPSCKYTITGLWDVTVVFCV